MENENCHGKVMEHENWPKVMEFCDRSWNFTSLTQNYTKFVFFVVNAKKLRSDLESLHIPMFSVKRRRFKIGERNGHGKYKNGHGKVMEKCFVKSVGTLLFPCVR